MWQVCVVESGSEQKIEQWCVERGHEVYKPMSTRLTKPRHKRQPVIVSKPAFPGYLFTKIEAEVPELEALNEFHGFLQFGLMQAFVSDEEIDRLREREVEGAFNETVGTAQRQFAINDEVRITAGPWQTLTGRVSYTGKDGRLKLVGGDMRQGPVWVPSDICEAA